MSKVEHKHEPWGTGWHEVIAGKYQKFAKCQCGTILTSHEAPIGARYNWEDWKVSA